MPRHRGHKNARNTEYAQRAAFDLRIRAEENTPPNQIQRMTPHQLPRTAKSAESIEFTGPIKSLNSINRRLTHHITLHTHCRLTVLEHSLELSWYVRADKGSNKIG